MYRIGEFSILKSVTVKTLRYYDKIDLFKPAVIDKYTGYRYYSEEQVEIFNKIAKYKELNFSLDQIKELLTNKNSNSIIKNKIEELTNDINQKEQTIGILKNMLGEDRMRVELRDYHEKYKIGKRYTISKKEDWKKKVQEVKEEIKPLNIKIENPIFCNFELGYVEEDIDCFIGYTLKENEIPKNIGSLEVITNSKEKKLIGIGKKEEINSIYQDMAKYAHDNNIQIRGYFVEVYQEDNVLIYVEAFDLKEENEDYIHYLNQVKIEDEIDEEMIGTYQIREILPDLKYMMNPKKQKSMLDTNFKELILKQDKTTNYKNITWNKKSLVINIDNKEIPLPIYKRTIDNKCYIEVLMNESYEYNKSQRPMCYLYEKE